MSMDQFCPWEVASYFVYSSNVPPLFFYSHIPAIVVALIVGLLVFYKSGKSRIGISLLTIGVLFSLWSIFDLILWATNRPDVVIFFWSLQILFEPLIYLLCLYLVYLFIKNGNDFAFKWKLFGILVYFPVVLLLFSSQNIIGVNLADCVAIEGYIAQYFTYIVETIFILSIIILIILEYRKISIPARRKEIVIFGLGVILFLVAFSSGNIIGSFTENWNLAQAGLIGMPIFIGFLAYLIVRFRTFNVKLIAAQTLIWGLAMLIGAQFFFIKISINFLLTGVTFVASIILGYFLIKSVKKEIWAREKIEFQKREMEIVNSKLTLANTRLKELDKQKSEFISLASHQLRSPLTAVKGYASLILEGDYGQIADDLKRAVQIIFDSTKTLATVVDDYLNVSRIELGQMKYDFSVFDFQKLVQSVVEELKPNVEKAGLRLEFNFSKDGNYSVNGDKEKLKQVIANIVDNSVKYTPQGRIDIDLGVSNRAVKLSIKDTGIGISKDVIPKLFSKFSRATTANKTNMRGTGLGLFIAKEIVVAHKGRIWAESEGEGKGSVFVVEIPVG